MSAKSDIEIPVFSGIPDQGLTFLKRLKKNNNREWFQAHKGEFEESLLVPMQSLVVSLRNILAPVAPFLRLDPRRSIHRIYRDIRFSSDKSPYKTHLAASFRDRSREAAGAGLYLHISPTEIASCGGLYMPSSSQLKSIRQAIATDSRSFVGIVESGEIKQKFGELHGERLRRPPQGFSKDHPLLGYLQYKQFFFIRNYEVSDCSRADFARKVAADFILLLPFVVWLNRHS